MQSAKMDRWHNRGGVHAQQAAGRSRARRARRGGRLSIRQARAVPTKLASPKPMPSAATTSRPGTIASAIRFAPTLAIMVAYADERRSLASCNE